MREVQRRRDAGESDVRPFPRGSDGKFHLALDDVRREQLAAGVSDVMAVVGTPISEGGGIAACLPGWGGPLGVAPGPRRTCA
jgi:hypothetical protein